MDFKADKPNLFLYNHLRSDDLADAMYEAGIRARDLYRRVVTKRSGALAASAYVFLTVGGKTMDRVVADLIVGEGTPRGGYGASHEFGIGIHPRSRVPPTRWMPQPPVDDLVTVLSLLDAGIGVDSRGRFRRGGRYVSNPLA